MYTPSPSRSRESSKEGSVDGYLNVEVEITDATSSTRSESDLDSTSSTRSSSSRTGGGDGGGGGGGCGCGGGGKKAARQNRGGGSEFDEWAKRKRQTNLRLSRSCDAQTPLKFVLLGDSSVGKSSLCTRWVLGIFKDQVATMGVSFLSKKVEVEGHTLQIELWDTAGQERFRSLTPMYYRGAHCAICVYDIANKQTFRGMDSWMKELKELGPTGMVTAMVGNKADLDPIRQVSKDELNAYAEVHGIEVACEVSALDGSGVEAFFLECCRACIKPATKT